MKKLLIPFLAVSLLYGCAGDARTRSIVALAIACDTYATGLDYLTPLRKEGKLSERMVARINDTNEAVRPFCEKDSEIDPTVGISVVEKGIGLLSTIKGVL